MDFFDVLTMMGGLALFMYGMHLLGEGLSRASGGRMEQILEKMTYSKWRAVLLGAGVTAVIQSSSATTVMVVGFVNSGMMKLSQAIGIIMGANVGKTTTGLLIALDNIDEVIRIIRGSQTVQIAKQQLMERFGLSDAQSQAIVDMRLRALTGLERDKLESEYRELQAKIAELKAILADEKKLLGVIREEIGLISDKYGDDRRTSIGFDEFDMSMEDLIPNDDTVVAMTRLGYIKRMSPDNFKSQNRGGKGIKGMQTIEEDYIEDLIMTKNHNDIMFFTNTGRVYRLKAYAMGEDHGYRLHERI